MTDRLVSVVLPCRDGMATLPELLDAVSGQRFAGEVELVAVDSGSTDGTAELLVRRVDRLVRIRAEDFDHGLTRNLGVEAARGELVVLLVQDAVPASDAWLEALIAPLEEDASVAGSFARQLPRPETGRLARRSLARWVAATAEPRVVGPLTPDDLERMTPVERMEACAFDNVCSCVRRVRWRERPFPSAAIAEDLEWGRDLLLAGWRIAYAPAAAVVHCHERGVAHELRRTILVHRRLHELFGVATIPRARDLPRCVAATVSDHIDALRRGEGPPAPPREVARAVALALAWPLGQYLGGRGGG
mgnify:FL=1